MIYSQTVTEHAHYHLIVPIQLKESHNTSTQVFKVNCKLLTNNFCLQTDDWLI